MSPNPRMQTTVTLATDEAAEMLAAEVAAVAPPVQTEPQTTAERMFTAEQLEAARRQEKDKLYPKLTELEQKVSLFEQERSEALNAANAAAEAEAQARREREEAEMSAKELLAVKEDQWNKTLNSVQSEWEQKFNALQQESEARQALLEKEREYQELVSYKNRRLSEEADNIMPELIDLIDGNTVAEIDLAISRVVEKSSAIVQNIQQSLPQPQQRPRSISTVGGVPNGPLENAQDQRVLTNDDIQSMSIAEYAQIRDRLLSPTARGGR